MYTFSGIDSSGKTTQIELLIKYCKENKIDVYKRWSKGRATPGAVSYTHLTLPTMSCV